MVGDIVVIKSESGFGRNTGIKELNFDRINRMEKRIGLLSKRGEMRFRGKARRSPALCPPGGEREPRPQDLNCAFHQTSGDFTLKIHELD